MILSRITCGLYAIYGFKIFLKNYDSKVLKNGITILNKSQNIVVLTKMLN